MHLVGLTYPSAFRTAALLWGCDLRADGQIVALVVLWHDRVHLRWAAARDVGRPIASAETSRPFFVRQVSATAGKPVSSVDARDQDFWPLAGATKPPELLLQRRGRRFEPVTAHL
jgi:hypothetical protein